MKLKIVTVTLVVMLIASVVYANDDNDAGDEGGDQNGQTVDTSAIFAGVRDDGSKFHNNTIYFRFEILIHIKRSKGSDLKFVYRVKANTNL